MTRIASPIPPRASARASVAIKRRALVEHKCYDLIAFDDGRRANI